MSLIMKALIPAAIIACLGSLASAATLQVDQDRSRIQVDVKATGHNFTGDLKKYTLTAAGDIASLKPAGLELTWDFNNFKTGDDKRDKEMIKWLGGGNPKGSFKFGKSWGETAAGGKAEGTLTIHGVSKTVSFPYSVKKEGDWVTVDGKVTFDHQDFKLPIIRSMAVLTVDPKLVVRFHVVGQVK